MIFNGPKNCSDSFLDRWVVWINLASMNTKSPI